MTTCDLRHVAAGLGAGFVAAVLAVAPPAAAQAQDQAAARVLFEEGRALTKAGKTMLACPKFEAASKLYTSAGILLNLGNCYEQVGRTASAWATFERAATTAATTGKTSTAAEASRRRALLGPRLARLAISVGHPVSGLEVQCDDVRLPMAAWGAPLPVDPGDHEISVVIDHKDRWTRTVEVRVPRTTVRLDVPAAVTSKQSGAVPIGAASGDPIVLYGGGGPMPPGRVSALSPRALSALEGRLFPRPSGSPSGCTERWFATLADARRAGEFFPALNACYDGSFTGRHAKERLCEFSLNECGASHAEDFGSKVWIVLNGTRVVGRYPQRGGTSIANIFDLDGDGHDELLAMWHWIGQGEMVDTAALVQLAGEWEHHIGGVDVEESTYDGANEAVDRPGVITGQPRRGGRVTDSVVEGVAPCSE